MEKIIDKKISEKKNIWSLFIYIYYGLLIDKIKNI